MEKEKSGESEDNPERVQWTVTAKHKWEDSRLINQTAFCFQETNSIGEQGHPLG